MPKITLWVIDEIAQVYYPWGMQYGHLTTPGYITLISGQSSYTHHRMHALLVELAPLGPVKLLIGGNRYDHYGINYTLAATTDCYENILNQNIHLSRAETCFQMVELLHETQIDRTPKLVFDLLATFYDESVSEQEIDQLLFEVIFALRRLCRQAAVIVSAHSKPNRPRLLKALENAVDWVEIVHLAPENQYATPGQ